MVTRRVLGGSAFGGAVRPNGETTTGSRNTTPKAGTTRDALGDHQ